MDYKPNYNKNSNYSLLVSMSRIDWTHQWSGDAINSHVSEMSIHVIPEDEDILKIVTL
jgi:hypothetical protein